MPNEDFDMIMESQQAEIDKIKSEAKIVDIKEFYLNKYQEMYQEILTNRLIELKEEMASLDEEISSLNNDVIQLDEDVQNNAVIKDQISSVEEKTYECYAKMEEMRFQRENEMDALQKETVELFHKHHSYVDGFQKILSNYLDHLVDNGTLIDEINKLFDLCNNEAYDLSVSIKENELKNKQMGLKLEEDLDVIRKELDDLLKEKKRQENRLYEVSLDHQKEVQADLKVRLDHKQNYQAEIKQVYIETSSKQLKEMNDLLIKFSLINKSPLEQIAELDALLEKFKIKLLSLDTKSNQEYQRNKRLGELNIKKKDLDAIKEQKELVDKKVSQLQNAYLVIIGNIKELDEHLINIKKNIQGVKFQSFLRFEEQFQKELKDGMNAILNKQKLIESLKEDRTYNLFDPDPAKIKNLDIQIHEEELAFNQIIKDYDDVKKDYEDFLNQNDNAQIKKLMEDGIFFEENLPKLKMLAQKLKDKIQKEIDISHELSLKLTDYQDLVLQIGELQNEDCN